MGSAPDFRVPQSRAPGDVTDPAYFPVPVEKAVEFGNGKIHIIVNNAGYTWDGVLHRMTNKQWRTILTVHNTAPFRLIREASPYFRVKDAKTRAIVNILSVAGTHGNAGQANYSLAKAGVTGLTKTIVKEWSQVCYVYQLRTNESLLIWLNYFGVRACTIAYGGMETRLTRTREEVAFIIAPDGQRVALGIPGAQLAKVGSSATAAYGHTTPLNAQMP